MGTFSCADDSDVVSGLNGQSEIGCDAATGEFDVGTASDGAHVKCGATVCGDPEDVVEIGAGASYTCDGNSCTFACSEEDVSPSLPQLICNSQTSKFVTGPIKRVSCNANCAPFGPDSGFRLDTKLKKFCKQQANGLEQCDLICRNRAKPTVEQTKQEVKRIRCHQNDRTGEAKWMAQANTAQAKTMPRCWRHLQNLHQCQSSLPVGTVQLQVPQGSTTQRAKHTCLLLA